MSVNNPASSSLSSPSPSRQRPPNGRSPSVYNIPRRPVAFQSHRRASGSALTIQTQFTKQPNLPSQQTSQEYSPNMRFSCLLGSVLGSPFLTTTDIAQPPPNFNLRDRGGEEHDVNQPRPPSPTPTADYSIIDTEELEADSYITRIPGGYPSAHHRSMSSSFAGRSFQSSPTWSRPRSRAYYTNPGFGGAPFMSLNHPTESILMPTVHPPANSLKTLLPRIWDVLSSPTKAFSGTNNSNSYSSSSSTSVDSSPTGSPRIFPHSISLPTTLLSGQLPSGRQSLPHSSTLSRAGDKGKRRAQSSHYSSFVLDSAEDLDLDELSPLDGEEGELIDEGCFVNIQAITGVDILALLPPELAAHIFRLVCPPPLSQSVDRARLPELGPLSNESKEESQVSLRAILACLAVSRTWRRLASDNSVWYALFLGRWDVDLRKAKESHLWKPESGSSPFLESPRQLKKQRWRLKHKAQALKFGTSSKSKISFPSLTSNISSSSLRAFKGLSRPKQNFPLQFDWKKMYMERFELEKRWKGTAVVQVPAFPADDPQFRNSGRSMNRRGSPRSRSLSPTTLLDYGNSSQDLLVESLTSGISASRTAPANMNTLYQEQKWEPKAMELIGHADSVYCVEFDSKRIITGSRDRTIMIWSLKTGRLLGRFAGAHTGSILCLKFEKDWDLESSDLSMLSQETDHSGKKIGFMFTGSSDCTICVWSLRSGDFLDEDTGYADGEMEEDRDRQVLAEPIAVLKGHTGGVLDLRIDEEWIVSCSKDTVIRVWDRKTLNLHRVLRGHQGPVNALGLQSGRVVSASGDGKMILWDIQSGECLMMFEGHDRGFACIEFKNDLIVSGSNDCKIKIWDAWTGECLRILAGHNGLVRAISFDPKTGRLLSASYDKVIKVWDIYDAKLIREFRHTHTSHIFDVQFDLGRIVSASHDQKICVLDFTAGLDVPVFI